MSREGDYRKILERRMGYLQARIENYQGKNMSYDLHELSALIWACARAFDIDEKDLREEFTPEIRQ